MCGQIMVLIKSFVIKMIGKLLIKNRLKKNAFQNMAKSLAFEMAGFVHTAFTVYTVVQFRANFVYAK